MGEENGEKFARPFGQELVQWSFEFRTRWFSRKKTPEWSLGGRRLLAGLGAFVYLVIAAWTVAQTDIYAGKVLASDTFSNYAAYFLLILVVFLAVVAFLVGRLVVFHDHAGGPVRIFLSGVALPAVVALIAKISLWLF